MHKIERLLQTLAPKGVEFRKLGEVCEILDNRRIPIAKNKRNPGIYPYYGANGIQDYIDSYIFDGDFVLVGEDGSVINKDNTPVVNWASGKIWVNNHAHVLQTKNELKLKFLYFYLQTIDVNYCVAGTPPKINQENLKKITIPIPPLEIQQEIVKILDAFTELNTELNTELKARKKQYQYYQNMLLDFNDINSNHKDAKERLAHKPYPKRLKTLLQTLAPKGVEFRKLGEVINIFKGKQLNKDLLLDYGEYPVMNGGIHASGYWNEYNTDYPKIIISQGGASAGYVNYMTSKFWAGAHCYAIELNSEKLNYKFLYYFLKNSQSILMKSQFGAGIPALNKADIETLTIPIPPLEIQQEIVKILDQFSILTTDLLAGIPAEIKARKKQYEYYREKLLTFKPLTPHKEVKKC
ncbi:restriction endonuclease subunit S [Helicobacter pylori]|nr:restriction endonuclease subunit S [Helicobacter pylori]